MTRRQVPRPGATACAVALAAAACTSSSGPATTEAVGLALVLPSGFQRQAPGDPEPGLDEAFWVGPHQEDDTAVGIVAARACDPIGEPWSSLRRAAGSGQHAGWADYRPTFPPVPVEVEGALEAVRARGTFSLDDESGDRVRLVHDELLIRGDGVVYRLRVEGSADNVGHLELDDLLASVRVVSTDCPA